MKEAHSYPVFLWIKLGVTFGQTSVAQSVRAGWLNWRKIKRLSECRENPQKARAGKGFVEIFQGLKRVAWGLKSIAKSTVDFNRVVESFVDKMRVSWGKIRGAGVLYECVAIDKSDIHDYIAVTHEKP